MTRKLRIDGLGRETQFIMPDSHMTDYGRLQWENKLTGMVLGYTKIAAAGGWHGIEEPITIYRVAGLNSAQVEELVAFLLDSRHSPAIGKLMRDIDPDEVFAATRRALADVSRHGSPSGGRQGC